MLRAQGLAGGASYAVLSAATCSAPLCVNGRRIVFTLATADLNGIKMNTSLCTGTADCVLSFNSSFIRDIAGNQVTVRTCTDKLTVKLVPTYM